MLALLRRGLNTWVARIFFLLLVASFGYWGVSARMPSLGENDDDAVATVGGRKIDMAEVQDVYRRQLAQVSQMFGGRIEPTPEIRRSVAAQAVERVVTQTAIDEAAKNIGIAVSDDALRQVVFSIPQLHGPDGQFNRAALDALLRNNNLTEPRFLALMRNDASQRQLLDAVTSGAVVSQTEAREVFAFQNEKRVADMVEFPFAAAAAPPAATEAQLTRWYDNHPDSYRTPELRRIKAVVLAPATVEKDIDVSDDDLRAAYAQHRGEFEKPERRSVQVITAPDAAKAEALAAAWRGGADWAAMQAQAKQDGASGVELDDASRAEFPAAELANAVFAATPDTVGPPVPSPLGSYIIKVTKVTGGGGKTFEQARDELRARVLADKAADMIDDRANKVDQLLASGTALDALPGDLGLAAVTGTLDAQGNTADGTPAPIPGPPTLKTALVQAAFAMKPGDPPRLTQAGQDSDSALAYFAVEVEAITPPATRPYAEVADAVKADCTRDAIRHEQDEAAARVLGAVQDGQSFEDAATVAGVTIRHLPPVGRAEPVEGAPAALIKPLFALKKTGEVTMIETADGFAVAVLTEIQVPDPDKDPIGYGQIRDALDKEMGQDIQAVYVTAVRARAKWTVNRKAVDQLAQAE